MFKMKRTVSVVSLLLSFVILLSMTPIAYAQGSISLPGSRAPVTIPEELSREARDNMMAALQEEAQANAPTRAGYVNLGMRYVTYYEVDPIAVDFTGNWYRKQLNVLTTGVGDVPLYDCFVMEITTAETGSFTERSAILENDFYDEIPLDQPEFDGTFTVNGIMYTARTWICDYIVFSDEHNVFEAVSKPTGWQGSSSGIANWLIMY